MWIKAHAGYEGNEMVDYLARQATLLPPNEGFPVPKSQINNIKNDCIYKQWQANWTAEKTCRQTKIFMDEIDSNRSKKIL